MYHFLLTIHIAACLGMILFVLLQTGRGAGLSMFGGGGDSLINTPSGSSFMKKFTAGLAATFAATSLFLTLLSDRTGLSSVTSKSAPQAAAAVAAPAPAAAAPSSQAASEAYKPLTPPSRPKTSTPAKPVKPAEPPVKK